MAVSGSQKTRIGGSVAGVGIKLSIIAKSPASVTGRISPRLAGKGGLAGYGGLAGRGGGLAG